MWVQAGVLLGLVGIGAGMVLINPRERHSAKPLTRRDPPTHAVYVWQHKWSPEVVTGIQKASRATTAFMVLGAEITFDKGEPRYRMPDVYWGALAATTKPVWVVLRIHELPEIRRAEQRNSSAVLLADVARTLLHEMARFGIQASGVQLDYDCAAEDLAEYASLLRMFREDLPNVSVSLTALPSWLNQPDVPGALAEVDHYVLQVHSIETPGHIDDPIKLCDTARVPGWLQHAVALGFPFLLALPTYGYRLNFAPGGEFLGLVAEDSQEARVGCTTREIMADPVEIASLVCALRSEPPPTSSASPGFACPSRATGLTGLGRCLKKSCKGKCTNWTCGLECGAPALIFTRSGSRTRATFLLGNPFTSAWIGSTAAWWHTTLWQDSLSAPFRAMRESLSAGPRSPGRSVWPHGSDWTLQTGKPSRSFAPGRWRF